MASRGYFFVVLHALVFASIATSALSQLSPNYYDYSCPKALSTIKSVVEASVQKERRMGASLLRLHFHDCFVNGCDGSILLDSTSSIDSEKNAAANLQSARGFEVVDDIKKAVDEACGKPVVSCADILAVAARDSVVALGGPSWKVRLGRRDSTTASREAADASIPAPFFSLSELITNFKNHGLDEKDLVVLSGGHSIGFARCVTFKDHIYNDSNIDPNFAQQLRYICPTNGGDSNLSPLDSTAAKFDINYYSNLVQKKGLLHSDQELFNGGSTDELVKEYSDDTEDFYEDFANSMIKMGNIQPLTGNQVFASIATSAFSQLSPNYYDYSCPKALSTIKSVVEASVQKERRMGASLLRLHFHDCFVNGCDGSILLDSTSSIDSEKNAAANLQSARGFEVVDDIKKAVDEACGKPVLGGPSWKVRLGRRDSTTASREAADASIPAPFFSLSELITNFKNHGLDEKDLVVLSGGHSIGFARCVTFKDHIYNDSNIDPHFAQQLKYICPTNGGDSNLSPLDSTAAKFDINYYSNLVQKKGLLHSDQELFNGGSTDELVKEYSDDTEDFYEDFANSMIKMGNIQSLTGNQVFASIATSAFSQLSPNYYDYSCPKALSTIKSVVEASVLKERRMGASLLRLHFHDCFVNGCDGSILLDSTSSIDSEKNAAANLQSARGFEVVDDIKKAVDEACGKPLGGPSWKVRLGRRDSTTASREAADASIPAPFFSLSELITNFKNHGLDEKDLVVLSGGHSIGFARCVTFKDHIYNDSNIDPNFAQQLKYICPTNGGDSNLSPLDSTAAKFDINYYSNLVQKKGLLHSDQELFNGGSTDELVKEYSDDTEDFYEDFANSMIKMGNIQPLTGNQGEIRVNCRNVN
ncbi:Cationic peroxidase 1 [Glycine max]|nr:Cationic peroxidase 1 [Glycine max]